VFLTTPIKMSDCTTALSLYSTFKTVTTGSPH